MRTLSKSGESWQMITIPDYQRRQSWQRFQKHNNIDYTKQLFVNKENDNQNQIIHRGLPARNILVTTNDFYLMNSSTNIQDFREEEWLM